LRETLSSNFDPMMEVILCKIASADGPVNALETQVLNSLVGKEMDQAYYNALLCRIFETRITLGSSERLWTWQLSGLEQGSDYDPDQDPVVKCVPRARNIVSSPLIVARRTPPYRLFIAAHFRTWRAFTPPYPKGGA
jgi:hypothetical protein